MSTEYYTEERCHIIEYHNTPDDPGVSVARARVEPGITTKWHAVEGTVERYVILEGTGTAEKEGSDPVKLSAGDTFTIPPGVNQRITNTGDSDLLFLCICTPRFEWNNYSSAET